jgi:hypothetical protein
MVLYEYDDNAILAETIKNRTAAELLRAFQVLEQKMTSRGLKQSVKLLPLPQPSLRARTDARTNPSAQRATQIRSVLARVYDVSRQNQITTTVP